MEEGIWNKVYGIRQKAYVIRNREYEISFTMKQ